MLYKEQTGEKENKYRYCKYHDSHEWQGAYPKKTSPEEKVCGGRKQPGVSGYLQIRNKCS